MEYDIIQKIISDVLGIEKDSITPKSLFIEDLGADSIEIYEIIMKIEEEFDVLVDEDYAKEVKTVDDAVRLLKDTIPI